MTVAASIQGFTPQGQNLPRVFDGPVKKFVYNESDNVELFCDAVGSPKPNVTWRKDGEQLIEADGSDGGGGGGGGGTDGGGSGSAGEANNPVLRITNIQRAQGGLYSCTANNYGPLDPALRKVEIVVQCKCVPFEHQYLL